MDLTYKEGPGTIMATAKEPESPRGKGHPPHPCACWVWISAKDSIGLCISCLDVKNGQAALSNSDSCPHCASFSTKTWERRLRVAVMGKKDPCLSSQPRKEPMECPQALDTWGEIMENVSPILSAVPNGSGRRWGLQGPVNHTWGQGGRYPSPKSV